MKYINYLLVLLFSVLWINTQAQQGRLTQVSSKYTWIKDQNKWIAIKGVYEQNGNTLSADSSILLEDDIKRQYFDAFNNVVITQPSGTTIYANKLNYDALNQIAVLTGNVRLVSPTSVLTTNHLTYNLRSKTGTYTGGGRIVSQADTITSQKAYYFENQGDAFFRGKVIVRTPQVKVFTDSMNYNQITKNTYFFGPTDIKGNNKQNLYTEKGVYNTATGVAKFSKNNLYNEDSKFLSGDSLYYNRDGGIGEAFNNVIFVDTLDKFYAYGNKGVYNQQDESILLTEKPYIITVVKNEEKSTSDSSNNTLTDTKSSTIEKSKDKSNNIKKGSIIERDESDNQDSTITTLPKLKLEEKSTVDSIYMTADTIFSKMIFAKNYIPLKLNLSRDGGPIEVVEDIDYGDEEEKIDIIEPDSVYNTLKKDSTILNIEMDSVISKKNAIDGLQKKVNNVSTVKASKKTKAKQDEPLTLEQTLKADSILRKNAVIPLANQRDSILNKALKTAQAADSIKLNQDTLSQAALDTAKTRIVKAYYNVRLFKSDLQAVADSVYYGMQDSMFRFMGRPMIWAQGSQISADTIYMQILNQRLDNALLKDNAFMVNVVLDTVKFNQMKGRKITAFFKNNNIETLFVDGNAENLIFSTNEKSGIVTEMFHDRSGRIKVYMENKEIIDYKSIRKVDQKVYPFAMVTQENEILPGFIWRPQDRPTSKEDLLNRKREVAQDPLPKTSKENVDNKKLEESAENI